MGELSVSKSEARTSEEFLILVAYIAKQPHGQQLSYNQVQHETGVIMDTAGKDKLRRAIWKNKREYTPIRNVGYELGSAHKTIAIVGSRLRRIDSQIQRGRRAHNSLNTAFNKEFTAEEKQAMAFTNTILHATETAIEESAKLYSQPKKIAASKPILPSNI